MNYNVKPKVHPHTTVRCVSCGREHHPQKLCVVQTTKDKDNGR
jgi:hypothetical protein